MQAAFHEERQWGAWGIYPMVPRTIAGRLPWSYTNIWIRQTCKYVPDCETVKIVLHTDCKSSWKAIDEKVLNGRAFGLNEWRPDPNVFLQAWACSWQLYYPLSHQETESHAISVTKRSWYWVVLYVLASNGRYHFHGYRFVISSFLNPSGLTKVCKSVHAFNKKVLSDWTTFSSWSVSKHRIISQFLDNPFLKNACL